MNDKELKFIHITKCAGSFVEKIGMEHNIRWGKFHTEYGWWHEIFPNKSNKLKQKYDWFVIVRNPYDRILSEYYCKWTGIGKKNMKHDVSQFNNYLINKIKNRNHYKKYRNIMYIGNHYTEQYKYLDDSAKIHIIKFENMYEEIKKLFTDYNIKIDIDFYINKKINSKESLNNFCKFTTNDFNAELISLINEVYKKDFELFGYDIT